MDKYEKQAEDFCKKHDVKITKTFNYYGPYFEEETTKRDIWTITIERHGKTPFTFNFGNSIMESNLQGKRDFLRSYGIFTKKLLDLKWPAKRRMYGEWNGFTYQELAETFNWPPSQKHIEPSDYSILATLTKYDPESFEFFCSEYGYSEDGITAERTYRAVQKEWREVKRMFGDCIEELNEIN